MKFHPLYAGRFAMGLKDLGADAPGIIATLVSARLATLHELQTIYGPYDAYRMLEIHQIDQLNTARVRSAGATG